MLGIVLLLGHHTGVDAAFIRPVITKLFVRLIFSCQYALNVAAKKLGKKVFDMFRTKRFRDICVVYAGIGFPRKQI